MKTDLTPDLQFLVGEPLSSVNFVMDYVELHFDGSYVRSLTALTVRRGDESWTFPAAGSRDELCALIGAEVSRIHAVAGGGLWIEFSDGVLVTASLSCEDGGETLHFHNSEKGETQWW